MEVIKSDRGPLVKIYYVERPVQGSGIAVKVYGELKIAAKEIVYARELKLNTIKWMSLTTHSGAHTPYHAQKYIYNVGEYDNYASIDIFDNDGTEITAGKGPDDGSVWLDFEALGE